jgi:hypothetical protein
VHLVVSDVTHLTEWVIAYCNMNESLLFEAYIVLYLSNTGTIVIKVSCSTTDAKVNFSKTILKFTLKFTLKQLLLVTLA